MKKRILFVDDEPLLLSTFRNVFRRDRARWDVEFVCGGVLALETLRTHVFDAVVCDMRMPTVDGAMVFQVLERNSPHTKRIMLSGSADEDELARARSVVHELLSKPCEGALLRQTIERLLAMPAESADAVAASTGRRPHGPGEGNEPA